MEEEIEDIVGDVKYTDSQKSVTTSNVYSVEFTDSGSEKHNSSGKDTYVIEWDSDDSGDTFEKCHKQSVIDLREKAYPSAAVSCNVNVQCDAVNKINKAISTSFHKLTTSVVSQEIFTQTSKTIFELAQSEGYIRKCTENKTLETQTSLISITENKSVKYRIEVSGDNTNFSGNSTMESVSNNIQDSQPSSNHTCNSLIYSSLEDKESTKSSVYDVNKEKDVLDRSFSEKLIHIIDTESNDNVISQKENVSDFEKLSTSDSDLEEDSSNGLNFHENRTDDQDANSDTSDIPKSVDTDVEELYTKLQESIDFQMPRSEHLNTKQFDILTPLSEESAIKKKSIHDITPNINAFEIDHDVLLTNSAGTKFKALPKEKESTTDQFKLPPICNNHSCPSSPHLSFLFSINATNTTPNASGKTTSLKDQRQKLLDRWEIKTKDLASGESPLIRGKADSARKTIEVVQLPPIHVEDHLKNVCRNDNIEVVPIVSKVDVASTDSVSESISIKDKIKELKINNNSRKNSRSPDWSAKNRNCSPGSSASPDLLPAERGCEAICTEILKRLRSASWLDSWFEIVETLEDVPRVLEKFWNVITEQRIADLLRQVICHVESARTQVARAACQTIAIILKNTNYTKKPDFYEAMSILLSKTGSFARPVRRAANVALDDIVCAVELSHAITALCIHGVRHKSALVRCAAARLLVICGALAGGGRAVLRVRPAAAAHARAHCLQAVAALLDDKSTDARKYAERLYSMLRPLPNFEAYYLTDVNVETASRQMKKYDGLLICGTAKETR